MGQDLYGDAGRARLELDAARSFQASWLIARFLAKQADSAAVATELNALLGQLQIQLQSPVSDYLDGGPDTLMTLLKEAGTQLKVRSPALLPYFEAGWNIPFDVAGNGGRQLGSIAETIELPPGLANPGEASSPIEWADTVAQSFHQRIYGPGT